MASETPWLGTRLGFETTHSTGTGVGVVILAAVLAQYATWMLADLLPRWLAFPVVGVGAAVLCYRARSPRQVLGVALALAGLFILLTPVLLYAPYLLYAGRYGIDPGPFVLTTTAVTWSLRFALVSGLVAGVAAVVGWPAAIGSAVQRYRA